MNTARNSMRQSGTFVELALARINELTAIAKDVTEVLGLPEDYCYAVLSGLAPILLEDYYESEQKEAATLSAGGEEVLPEEEG